MSKIPEQQRKRTLLCVLLCKSVLWRVARVKTVAAVYCSRSTSPRSVSSISNAFVIVVSAPASLHPCEGRSNDPMHKAFVNQITKRCLAPQYTEVWIDSWTHTVSVYTLNTKRVSSSASNYLYLMQYFNNDLWYFIILVHPLVLFWTLSS